MLADYRCRQHNNDIVMLVFGELTREVNYIIIKCVFVEQLVISAEAKENLLCNVLLDAPQENDLLPGDIWGM